MQYFATNKDQETACYHFQVLVPVGLHDMILRWNPIVFIGGGHY